MAFLALRCSRYVRCGGAGVMCFAEDTLVETNARGVLEWGLWLDLVVGRSCFRLLRGVYELGLRFAFIREPLASMSAWV